MLTAKEVEQLVEAGDEWCQCGIRESQHPRAGCKAFTYSVFFNELVIRDEWTNGPARKRR